MRQRLHVPLLTPEGIIPHLGAAHHWKDGRSAKSLVDQWWNTSGLPSSISKLLDQADEWRGARLIDAFVERCTDLEDGRSTRSQSDLMAIVAVQGHLGIVCVEAKVNEGFDKTVDRWRLDASDGKIARLEKLCERLQLDPAKIGQLRYQLFHRTASALLEAKRYCSTQALMLVQSWSTNNDGFADFADFCLALGLSRPQLDRLSEAVVLEGITLRLAWWKEA